MQTPTDTPRAPRTEFVYQAIVDIADRQLWRPDGVRELDALYELRCDDGTLLTVHNQVLIDEQAPGGRYAMSQLRIIAPEGPHAWLSRRVLVGALTPLQPARAAVCIRVYQVL